MHMMARLRTQRHDGLKETLFLWLRKHDIQVEREVALRVLQGDVSQRPKVMDSVLVAQGDLTWVYFTGCEWHH